MPCTFSPFIFFIACFPRLIHLDHRCNQCSSSSCLLLVSKENDLESSASSLDTDMEDNSCPPHDTHLFPDPSSSTLIANPVLIPSRSTTLGMNDDLQNVSMTVRDGYLPSDLPHMHLLEGANSIADPNLNHHNANLIPNSIHTDLQSYHSEPVLQFYPDSSTTPNSSSAFLKRSKAMMTPSSASSNFDPNGDINFLYDLVTPPTNHLRPSLLAGPLTNNTPLFDHPWNGRMLLPNAMIDSQHQGQQIKQEHQHRQGL